MPYMALQAVIVTTLYIAELVMSQKMAAFVLASMGKVCWRVFHCLFADTA